MDFKDFDIRKREGWTHIGFWCRPETEKDAQKLAAVLRRIMDGLAEEVREIVPGAAGAESSD